MCPYPGRPVRRPLERFAGTGGHGGAAADAALVAFVLEEYAAGRSLREIAELTDRSHSAVRYLLDRRGVLRRGRGARPLDEAGPDAGPAGAGGASGGREAEDGAHEGQQGGQ